ncbi:FecR family protein [Solitalea lacus]|uniref:FecR family protein n=1 Tax=Solitalea lacus TaxID=2911172 RepID=UPI001ED9D80B|nr:FecR family protein [Solitalea lacus]UKJ06961.1 DUF4974 domain-containing protein [Solitalea lacus]
MNKTDIIQLLEKYKMGQCTAEEVALLESWYLELSQKPSTLSQTEVEDAEKEMWDNLKQHIEPKTVRLWPRIAIAASLAFAIAFGGYLYLSNQKQKTEQAPSYAIDIAPGKNSATLILADGKKIILSDATKGELAKEAGVSISKTAEGQIVYEVKDISDVSNRLNTLSTARGETFQVRLPDGTMVMLNAASSIKYPVSFASLKTRNVELNGEAYFEVTKDKTHPFIVKSGNQEVEVLGTHFNVNNYADEIGIKTTLLEGSVKVVNTLSQLSNVLKPGEQAEVNALGQISVDKVNVSKAVAWTNGKFVFENESIESIMRKLARWYDVEVVYTSDVSNIAFSGIMSRNSSIAGILNKISHTGAVHFKIDGRRVTVMP